MSIFAFTVVSHSWIILYDTCAPLLSTEAASVKSVKWSIDTTDYIYDGKPLGDHYPVVATFQVTDRVSTGIVEVDAETTDSGIYYNLNGQQVTTPRNGVFIQNGSKTVIR